MRWGAHRVGGVSKAEGNRVPVQPLKAVRVELQADLPPHVCSVDVLALAAGQRPALPQDQILAILPCNIHSESCHATENDVASPQYGSTLSTYPLADWQDTGQSPEDYGGNMPLCNVGPFLKSYRAYMALQCCCIA